MNKKLVSNSLYDFDKRFYNEFESIIACDEVGRGSLAGPIVVACVNLKPNFFNEKVRDSKKLNPRQREELSILIKENGSFHFCYINSKEIDLLNPLEATKKATTSCLNKFEEKGSQIILLDYLSNFSYSKKFINIKKGDNTSFSIASASILAKVERDNFMINLNNDEFDIYDFFKNKGYGTKNHLEAIKIFGPSKIHRLSYKPLKK
ncbi:ribonuclease HII [[Mycoplasma] mobile]|uniref:Ribonuclease n=1 Tax=Mycoplasma mobile (strain ATCC 43663 / 163K / NCTC 11711) TaxID=267748 RepID=Q6KH21_MYCM1|nr:ribonuclease HII [[Mycoplasma] mobile]AAT28110.1 ribonuclease HII [Mycoplasma mobile 163K]